MIPVAPRTLMNCAYRQDVRRIGERDLAVCGIVRTLLSDLEIDAGHVGEDACQACCQQFAPSPTAPNPVVASLVYKATRQILDHGATSKTVTARAQQLRAFAASHLEVAGTTEIQPLLPARVTSPCIFQGSAAVTPRETHDATFACHHPAHNIASESLCRVCRDWRHLPIRDRLTASELIPAPPQRHGNTVREWAVGVTTAPRPQSTLAWCLDSLIRAGWSSPHLFVDASADVPEQFRGLPMTWRDQRIGAWANYYLALAELVASQSQADAYLLVQDDAFFFDREDLCDYLRDVLWPSDPPGLVSLYCSSAYTAREAGWNCVRDEWLWGALAFVFPRELAREFVSDPLVMAHAWDEPSRAHIDALIGRWSTMRGVPIWYPSPSLVQHVGNTSAIWTGASNSGPRLADWFASDCDVPFAQATTLADFPEQDFPVADGDELEYRHGVAEGYQRMRGSRVVIAGLCRDARRHLPRTVARIERLGGLFAEYQVVLFENDSTDRTREYLEDWSREKSRVTLVTERYGDRRFPQVRSVERAARMAHYRNVYRQFIVERGEEADFVIIVDTDLRGGWSYDGIAHTFGHQHWDFVGSAGVLRLPLDGQHEQRVVHFDAWAYRELDHPEPHDFEIVNRMKFGRGRPMLRVDSCFGGLGIYRGECFRAAEYSGEDCEHVMLHRNMRVRGFDRLFLNPSQITIY